MASPKRPPAFQFYAEAWIGSTSITMMPPAVEGTYIRLLARQWKCHVAGESLPQDPALLRLLTKLTPAEWKKAWPLLEKHFPVIDGGRENPTLAAVWRERLEFIATQREKGKKGGRPPLDDESRKKPGANPEESRRQSRPEPEGKAEPKADANPDESSVVCSLKTELRSVGKPTDRSAREAGASGGTSAFPGESTVDAAMLLTTAANSALDAVYPTRRPFLAATARAQQMAADLRRDGVDLEWAAATIFHYARTLTRPEPPSSLAWFERFVREKWAERQAKQDAAAYRPASDDAGPSSARPTEVDQMHAFAVQYAKEGKAEWIRYCDDRNIAWRAA